MPTAPHMCCPTHALTREARTRLGALCAAHAEALAALTAHSVAAAAEGQQRGVRQQPCAEAVLISLPRIAPHNDSAIQSLGPAIQAGIVPLLQVGAHSEARVHHCSQVRASQFCRHPSPSPSAPPVTPAPLSCLTVRVQHPEGRARQASRLVDLAEAADRSNHLAVTLASSSLLGLLLQAAVELAASTNGDAVAQVGGSCLQGWWLRLVNGAEQRRS